MTMKPYNEKELQQEIYEAINEQNHFWWGCVIGLQYGRLSVKRVEKSEELSYGVKTEADRERTFQPIVRVKYGSPYKDRNPKGHLVSWYDEVNHNPVNVSYLLLEPVVEVFETGARKFYINSLILFTDNTGELIKLRDEIYENHKHETELKPETFVALCDAARYYYLREVETNHETKPISDMRYKKYYADVKEFCQIYVNRFEDWKSDHL